ncbi:MAG: EF-hand domain-containing protein [Candidatus Acidiferrum sp.]
MKNARINRTAHERIFKAMDTDHDGTVTLEEMQAFMSGGPTELVQLPPSIADDNRETSLPRAGRT